MPLVDRIRKSQTGTNSILAFSAAIFSGIWVNMYTGNQFLPKYHWLLVSSILLLLVQVGYNRWASRPPKRTIPDLLDIIIRLVQSHAGLTKAIRREEIRVLVHFCQKAKPGKDYAPTACLVLLYNASTSKPEDRGCIPIDYEDFKTWYINLKAFHSQKAQYAQPTGNKPADRGFYCQTPSLFKSKSVLSIPLREASINGKSIGTLTIDSLRSQEDLGWKDGSEEFNAFLETIQHISELVTRIHLNEDEA